MTKNKNHKAFSLIEISMVILVIGILIAGVSQGVDLYDDYRLASARNLTKNSLVNRIPDLEMWLETTSENSLATGTTSFTDKPNPADLDPIGRWNNINPNILPSARNHATQATYTNNQPKYIRKGINGLPALLFDGTDDFFSFNGDFLVGSDYTIFVVEAKNPIKTVNFFIAGSQSAESQNLILGYWFMYSQRLTHSHYGGKRVDIAISDYSNQVSRINSFVFGKNLGKKIYINTGQTISDASLTSPLSSFQNSSIGKAYTQDFFQGAIAEIIFYTRALTDKERQGVEAYLAKKWGIKLG
jgi:prepilin-type N-terminal cleavage/methylation domain-containing protein